MFVSLAFVKQLWADTYYLNYISVTGITKSNNNNLVTVSATSGICKYELKFLLCFITLFYIQNNKEEDCTIYTVYSGWVY